MSPQDFKLDFKYFLMAYKQNRITGARASWYNPDTHEIRPDRFHGAEYFRSQHELKVYRHLTALTIGSPSRLSIVRERCVTIKPPGTEFGILQWKVDFTIQRPFSEQPVAYIEAKGGWILQNPIYKSEFVQKLAMMDFHYPTEYARLYVVGDESLLRDENLPFKVYSVGSLLSKLFEDSII